MISKEFEEFKKLSAGGADDGVVRRRSRPTTKWSDSKSLYLAIDASSGADSFETEKLRLSAFHRKKERRKWTSRTQDTAILNWSLKSTGTKICSWVPKLISAVQHNLIIFPRGNWLISSA